MEEVEEKLETEIIRIGSFFSNTKTVYLLIVGSYALADPYIQMKNKVHTCGTTCSLKESTHKDNDDQTPVRTFQPN